MSLGVFIQRSLQRENSTGSAGLIQTITRFGGGHIVVGVLGIIATVGWTLQGVGLLYYYRAV